MPLLSGLTQLHALGSDGVPCDDVISVARRRVAVGTLCGALEAMPDGGSVPDDSGGLGAALAAEAGIFRLSNGARASYDAILRQTVCRAAAGVSMYQVRPGVLVAQVDTRFIPFTAAGRREAERQARAAQFRSETARAVSDIKRSADDVRTGEKLCPACRSRDIKAEGGGKQERGGDEGETFRFRCLRCPCKWSEGG